MATPQRPRPQLARINAMKKSPYSAEVGLDDLAACGGELDVGGEFASQTSFRIRGGVEVAALFRKLGLSGPEDFTIPPAVYASRRRPSLEASPGAGAGAEGSSSSPPEIPEISGRDVMVATRTETAGDGEQARLAIKLVQSEVVEAFARTYEGSGAESSSRLVESEKMEASRREVEPSRPGSRGNIWGADRLGQYTRRSARLYGHFQNGDFDGHTYLGSKSIITT